MSVRPLLTMGDERLLQTAVPVTDFSSVELSELIQDMHDTMQAHDGAGLAAPQIGAALRVVIFGGSDNVRYPERPEVPYTVLINPHIDVLDSTQELGWEGCLSLPGLRGEVPRFTTIRYSGFTADGTPLEREAHGFHARVVQHEVDHLDGLLYPLRMPDMSRFGFEHALDL
ncbi:MAG: peptide deformylase [Zetaproteobacteria bacterium CG12_big_fil_rev_8_21_14_0_65_55_1124]|nr:MAG: peptide deformylase [Zetaproteobacteria bacterium CG1_02_55_237]PIS18456.1 MAG: peptide deformylase [Zetaproteobacteria bacterium CG08_land_8_20_14_0_20_55_17]PIW42214.1 MAG: peptide deformylase [Zetaproteobacteria bacterium CG12_big_fil_rev_8_21_14_0_65_55_1124]PIY53783.1 MAG: peptide deformylase [Zetaproteobacteria bacterium CG_4_10_14_0_8_um_filter_55_43]PIZ38476.1 MAG: peptide deformylase [Zetaproteobacteria bacterium CG_4_10_14_0_2_um_filter_55_20]PJB80817.1 MAG: peptide deformyla